MMRMGRRIAASLAGATVLAVALSGCASASDEPRDEAAAAPGFGTEPSNGAEPADDGVRGAATFSAGGRTFTVELRMCAVHDGGDVLLSGPARESGTGVTGYLEGDATVLDGDPYGEFRLDVGADGPRQSTDEFVALGNSAGGTLAYATGGAEHVFTATTWDHNGDALGEGSLAFRCS